MWKVVYWSLPICHQLYGKLDLQLPMESGRGIQHYMIRFVSDLWQVGGFLRVLRFPPPILLTATL
jgi:hypothetical protein